MSALVLMVALAAEAQCFVPRETSPGWKQVALPPDGPALAAPEGVEQFRSDELVEVVDDRPGAYLAGTAHYTGRTEFSFTPPNGACVLEASFKEPLRGAKVDVSGWGSGGTISLMREDRVAGRTVRVNWGDNGVRSVTVVVHD